MISISKKKFSLIIKLGIVILVLYIIGFCFFQVANFYKISFEKDSLTEQIKFKKNESRVLKIKTAKIKQEMVDINKRYIKHEELDAKVKDIFERMSLLNYNLKYLNAKKVCVDNYILVAQLTADNKKGIQAGEGIFILFR